MASVASDLNQPAQYKGAGTRRTTRQGGRDTHSTQHHQTARSRQGGRGSASAQGGERPPGRLGFDGEPSLSPPPSPSCPRLLPRWCVQSSTPSALAFTHMHMHAYRCVHVLASAGRWKQMQEDAWRCMSTSACKKMQCISMQEDARRCSAGACSRGSSQHAGCKVPPPPAWTRCTLCREL